MVSVATTTKGAIVVVAKCPIPGKSKTRLIPLLGKEGSTKLGKAMLCDVLMSLDKCPSLSHIPKILLHAPNNEEGKKIMGGILTELDLKYKLELSQNDDKDNEKNNPGWTLLPMIDTNLTSTDLGSILTNALQRVRKQISGSIVLLGMDSPELHLEEIIQGLQSDTDNTAILCPAYDGGYGMAAIPPAADEVLTFRGVHWSHPLTAVSQLKALTDQPNLSVKLGRLMYDIDETKDVEQLCQRLSLSSKAEKTNNNNNNNTTNIDDNDTKVLYKQPPMFEATTHPNCFYSKQALIELGQIETNFDN